jgi:hypothetical protein
MTTTNHQELIKGQTYSVVRSTVSGRVGSLQYVGRFGVELAFRTAEGEHWTVPAAYFVEAVR